MSVSAVFVPVWISCGVNGPLWTLTSQAFFYMLFPVLTDYMHTIKSTATIVRTLTRCFGKSSSEGEGELVTCACEAAEVRRIGPAVTGSSTYCRG